MTDGTIAHPKVVSRGEWRAARESFLAREKAFTRERDALNAERRRLPMVRVEEVYVFEGPEGEVRLIDLFAGRRQLVVGHFMFDPAWEDGCPGCTHLADEMSKGHLRHLRASDTEFAYASRAPYAKLAAYKARRGWTFPWYSSGRSRFNYDFHVTLDRSVAPLEYNYKTEAELAKKGLAVADGQSAEMPGFSMFLRVGGEVFHTYSTYARGGESFGGAHYLLDLTAYGRQQDFEDSPPGWPQRPTYG